MPTTSCNYNSIYRNHGRRNRHRPHRWVTSVLTLSALLLLISGSASAAPIDDFSPLTSRHLVGEDLIVYNNVRSAEDCALKCRHWKGHACRAFEYNSAADTCSLTHSKVSFTGTAASSESHVLNASVDFDVRTGKILNGHIIERYHDADSAEACAQRCASYEGPLHCSSFTHVASSNTCELKRENSFRNGTYPGYTSGVSRPIRQYVTLNKKIPYGTVLKTYRLSSPAACAGKCNDWDGATKCQSYTYSTYLSRCSLYAGTRLHRGEFDSYVAGVKRTAHVTRQVQVLYIIPKGQTARADAEAAIADIMRVIQEYYLSELGTTFELAAPLVTKVSTYDSPAKAVNWKRNVDSIKSELPLDYLSKGNLIVSIIEGSPGGAGGSYGIVKMTGGFWNTSYNQWQNDAANLTAEVKAWAHELGHALGLMHTGDLHSCLQKHFGVTMGPFDPCLMDDQGVSDRDLYEYRILDHEKDLLRWSPRTWSSDCLAFLDDPTLGNRPQPSKMLARRAGELRAHSSPAICLDLASVSGSNGVRTTMQPCNGSEQQIWILGTDGHIRNKQHQDQCLDAAGPSSAVGTPIQIWKCLPNQINQLWRYRECCGHLTTLQNPDRCIQAANGQSDAAVELADCVHSSGQSWFSTRWKPAAVCSCEHRSG